MDPGWLDDADLQFVDGDDVAAATRLAGAARRRGLPVVLNAGSVRAGTGAPVALCTDVVAASVFGPAFTGETAPAENLFSLRRLGPKRAAITFGAGGALGLDDHGLVAVPAFAVPVVDTKGAGDAFLAGYARRLQSGGTFSAALEYGAAVAALKCRGWGGRDTRPDAAELERPLAGGRRLPPCRSG